MTRQPIAICDYCAKPARKVHVVTLGRSTAIVCKDCYARTQQRYAAEVAK